MKLYQNPVAKHLFYLDGTQQDAYELAQVWADCYAENNNATVRVQKDGSSARIIAIPNTFGALGTIVCSIQAWVPRRELTELDSTFLPPKFS